MLTAGAASLVVSLVGRSEARGQVAVEPGATQTPMPAIVDRPNSARRVVRVFDFEEQRTNPTPVPRYWLRAQDDRTVENGAQVVSRNRPGFPAWNEAKLDYQSPAYRGVGSLTLPTAGGSTSLLLESGVIPVFQSADYNISAYIRTEKLAFARARVVVRLLDSAGATIPDGEHASELVVSEGEWTPVSIDVEAASDTAAFLELELQLLQPEQADGPLFPASTTSVSGAGSAGARGEKKSGLIAKAFGQDLAGAAWFDDLTVTQLPRIELATNGVGHLVRSPESPELRLEIRDLTGEKLRAELTVFDTHGRVVDRMSKPLGSGRVRTPWTPKIARFGWYRAALGVYNERTIVGQAMVDFVWLPPEPEVAAGAAAATGRGAAVTRKLGLQVGAMPPRLAGDLPEMVRRLGLGAVALTLPVDDVTRESAAERVREGAPAIDGLLAQGVEMTLAIDRMPGEYCAEHRADLSDPWTALRSESSGWEPYLDPFMEKYGQRVRRWRIGRASDDVAFWRSPLAGDLAGARKNLGRLVSVPTICVPWRIDRGLSVAALGSMSESVQLSVLVPEDVPYGAIEDFAGLWKSVYTGGASPEMAVVFEPMPTEEFGHASGAGELVKRAVVYWKGFDPFDLSQGATSPPTAFLAFPWEYREGRTVDLRPRPELAAWANVNRRLADRRVVGELAVTPGVRCFILAPAGEGSLGQGALVAWNETAEPEDAVLRAYLGPGPVRVVDLYGNSADAAIEGLDETSSDGGSSSPRRPGVVVPLGSEPVFIEGIDPMLTRFLASVHFDPGILLSTNENHENALVFENPWTTGLDLRAYVIKPGGLDANGVKDRTWKISPRAGRVIVPSGEMGRIPITIAFSPAEEAGPKDFVLDLDVTADKAYGLIRVRAPLELGLKNVKLELTPVVLSGGDVLIEALVANTGTVPVDIELTAFAPGQPRVKNQINRLPAGNQVVRRFPYPGGAKDLLGKRVFVAATDAETKGRLNKSVMVD